MTRISLGGLLLLLSSLIIGCSSTRQSALEHESGFLSDYPSLSRDEESGGYSWARTDFRLNQYEGIYVPAVEIWVGEDAPGLDTEDAGRLTGLFHERVIEKLKRHGWKVIDKPDPGSLTLRLALTELDAANPYGNIVTSIPYPSTPAIQLLALGADVNIFVGEVSTEVQLVESSTGKILAEGMDRRVGAHSLLNIGSTWGDVHDAMGVWTNRLGNGLSKLDESR